MICCHVSDIKERKKILWQEYSCCIEAICCLFIYSIMVPLCAPCPHTYTLLFSDLSLFWYAPKSRHDCDKASVCHGQGQIFPARTICQTPPLIFLIVVFFKISCWILSSWKYHTNSICNKLFEFPSFKISNSFHFKGNSLKGAALTWLVHVSPILSDLRNKAGLVLASIGMGDLPRIPRL